MWKSLNVDEEDTQIWCRVILMNKHFSFSFFYSYRRHRRWWRSHDDTQCQRCTSQCVSIYWNRIEKKGNFSNHQESAWNNWRLIFQSTTFFYFFLFFFIWSLVNVRNGKEIFGFAKRISLILNFYFTKIILWIIHG